MTIGLIEILAAWLSPQVAPITLSFVLFISTAVYIFRHHRSRLLKCLFDDDSLNISKFHLIHNLLFCRCLCSGSWTRCFTQSACCGEWHNRNLVTVLTEYLGVVPQPVRVKKIVVGNIPTQVAGQQWSWLLPVKQDVYVSVDGNETLDQMATEVVQDTFGTPVVQFTSALTLNIRDSVGENQVRFSLRRSELIGYTEIAHVSIPAVVLLELARSKVQHDIEEMESGPDGAAHVTVSGGIRLAMPLSEGFEDAASATPWIFLIVAPVHEMQQLRQDPSASTIVTHDPYHISRKGSMTPRGDEEKHPFVLKCQEAPLEVRPLAGVQENKNQTAKDSKLAEAVKAVKQRRERRYEWHKVLLFLSIVFIPLVYMPAQVVMSICYEQYKMITVINTHGGYKQKNATREIEILHDCHMHADAVQQWLLSCREKNHKTFLVDKIVPINEADTCRPDRAHVSATCGKLPESSEQPHFVDGVHCPRVTCLADHLLDKCEAPLGLLICLIGLSLCWHSAHVARWNLLDRYFPEQYLSEEGKSVHDTNRTIKLLGDGM
eukprot:TRINITY_DN24610_c0_g1_i1.p1 TRINITY_DN24610_c0_g1~~TRINITY_DN24610_c0_g1_i1.p1  ORF type:complete len:547 (-),score=64.01 TRINITY_DN24610_c0_g1_i1:461-2101(-)